jgi:cob(I)alamin adenosyltransferase
MKRMSLLLVLMLILTSLVRAQDASPQAPPSTAGSGSRDQMRSEQGKKMMEMHKQQMEAMKADMEKMKSSLAQMKTNVATISDPTEKGRWQSNVDMWEVLVSHMEQMLKHMESMGPGMMHDHSMGGPPSSPPAEKKPE